MGCRVMIIDLDAHQGNGHEIDFAKDRKICHLCLLSYCSLLMSWSKCLILPICAGRVYILDMFNSEVYPLVSHSF